jgi:peptidoglycan/xylan/chitin deacetylase (PgdA/CDA1 family)
MKILLPFSLLFLFTVATHAGGPEKIAKSDRSLWPYKITSSAAFDFASKMEMLVFAGVLDGYDALTGDSLKTKLKLKSVSMPSVQAWKDKIKNVLLANFHALGNMPAHDPLPVPTPRSWNDVITTSGKLKQRVPANLSAWYANATDFYHGYVYEQLRLAALFPRTSSEILTLQPTEVSGTEYGDRQFLLTFDDGPSPASGNTDKLIATLVSHHLNGVFFVVGDMLQARLKAGSVQKLRTLYNPVVVGSHGKVHKQHPKYEGWAESISFTDHLIDSVIADNHVAKYFRPPYGQRNDQMITYLDERNTRVMLWNIDSQDWNATITPREVADRVTTLMLLWRRGIILFHDTHSKANTALPMILDALNGATVQWLDAKALK